jgi:hypothetical protein
MVTRNLTGTAHRLGTHRFSTSTTPCPARIEKNVIDSDGTLIITHVELTGGSEFDWEMAKKHKLPYFHADLSISDSNEVPEQNLQDVYFS